MEKRIGDVCNVGDGVHAKIKRQDSGVEYLTSRNFKDGGLDLSKVDYIAEEDFNKHFKAHSKALTKPAADDVVFSIIGSIGEPYLVRSQDRFGISSSVAILRPDKDVLLPKYLYYWVKGHIFQDALYGIKGGVAQGYVSLEMIRSLPLSLPSLSTQRKFASLLSAYDDLIENNTRRIEILEEMAQAIYREWFVHFSFPGHEKVEIVESAKGQIPEGWESVQVGDVVRRIPSGKKYSNKTVADTGSVPVLDQGRSGIIGYHDNDPDVIASEESPVIVFANHTCYQRIIQFPFSGIQNVLPFLPAIERYRDVYWLHWATKDLVKFNDYKGHWPEFVNKELVLPPAKLCTAFGQYVKPLVQHQYILTRKNSNLRKTRDLLLPKLISGEVNVEDVNEKVIR